MGSPFPRRGPGRKSMVVSIYLGYSNLVVSTYLLVSSDAGALCEWDKLGSVDGLPLVPELFSRELWVALDVL